MKNKTKNKTYYMLETDSYGQPNGYIIDITKKKYLEYKKLNIPYLYDNYDRAYYRAMD